MHTQHYLHRTLYVFVVLTLVLTTVLSASSQPVTAADNSTYLLADIHPGSLPTEYMGFKRITENLLFFAARDSEHGYEPWVTDGTAEGTRLLLDIWPGSINSMNPNSPDGPYPHDLLVYKDELYFFAEEPDGFGLWKTGGTPETTVRVLDADGISWLRLVENQILFLNNEGLVATNGTPGNITLIGTTQKPGKVSITAPVAFQGKLYYFTREEVYSNDQTLVELWSCGLSGCDAAPIKSWENVPGVTNWNRMKFAPYKTDNLFFFVGYSPAAGFEIWQSNGTTAGTEMVGEVIPGEGQIYTTIYAATANQFFFIGGTSLSDETAFHLYATSGKAVGGIQQLNSQVGNGTLEVRDTYVYFIDRQFPEGTSYWARTNGTPEGTVRFDPGEPYRPGAFVEELNQAAFFTARPMDVSNMELYIMPGQPSEMHLFADIRPGTSGSSPRYITRVNGKLVFTADDGIHGRELWAAEWSNYQVFLPMIAR